MRVKRTASMAQSVGDIERMGTSWMRHLRTENKAAQTLTAYGYAWSQLRDYLVMHGLSLNATDIRAEHVEALLADVLEHRSPATANNRYRGLQQFFAWLAAEREILESPMLNMKPPRFPDAPVPVPSAEDVKKLLATCDPERSRGAGTRPSSACLLDSGIRLAELTNLRMEDFDLDTGTVRVVGKGSSLRTETGGIATRRSSAFSGIRGNVTGTLATRAPSCLGQALEERCRL
jgi:integrase/recombinase XerC